MRLTEAESLRRKAIELCSSPIVTKLLATETNPMVRDVQLAQLFGDAALETTLRFNERKDWTKKINCYGYAVGTEQEWDATPEDGLFLMWGWLSRGFRTSEFASQLPDYNRFAYFLLADGLSPVSSYQVDSMSEEHRLLVGCSGHFFARVKPGLWVHKDGDDPVSVGYGSQPIITNIQQACTEYMENNVSFGGQFWGFYEVAASNRATFKSTEPPSYSDATVQSIGMMLERYRMLTRGMFMQAAAREMKALGIFERPEIRSKFNFNRRLLPF